jgi:hypothetical protein
MNLSNKSNSSEEEQRDHDKDRDPPLPPPPLPPHKNNNKGLESLTVPQNYVDDYFHDKFVHQKNVV